MNPDPAANLKRILASSAYRLAEQDIELLARDELRPVRSMLERLKPELGLPSARIHSRIVVFGSARVDERSDVQKRVDQLAKEVEAKPNDAAAARQLARTQRQLEKCHYYEAAREFARLVSGYCQRNGDCDYVIITGGGPGIMEAANRGAFEVGAKSVGLNIDLPHEQMPNPYITPELCFQFRYFAMRKLHFLMRARALVLFPGGFGTLDELFDALTLMQTGRMDTVPVVLYGEEYWRKVIDFEFLADEGAIDDEDLALIRYAETPEAAWRIITDFYDDEMAES